MRSNTVKTGGGGFPYGKMRVWKISMLATGQQGYTNSGFLQAKRHRQTGTRARVHAEQSTITKMHWLKLNPYRYQTKS